MKTVSILGTDYPIKFGLSAMQSVLKIIGAKSMKDFEKLDEIGIEKFADVIHAGLVNGAKVMSTDAPDTEKVKSELDCGLQLYYDTLAILLEDVRPSKPVDKAGN